MGTPGFSLGSLRGMSLLFPPEEFEARVKECRLKKKKCRTNQPARLQEYCSMFKSPRSIRSNLCTLQIGDVPY